MRIIHIFLLSLFLQFPVTAAPLGTVEITEWTVPWPRTRPRDPYVANNRMVWFVGQGDNYIASFDLVTEKFNRIDLEKGTAPHNLIIDDNGKVWFAGNQKAYIGRYDPVSKSLTKYPMPDKTARDPHTLIFSKDKKHIWFTMQLSNLIGRLSVVDGSIDLIKLATANARPYGIVIAPNGTPWVALFNRNTLASIDPKSLTITEHELPRSASRPRRLAATTDGRIWYVDYSGGYLGVLDPESKKIKEWRLPSGDRARPYGMTVDSSDRIWLVETGPSPNNFVGFDSNKEVFFSSTPIPSGAGSVRHMDYHQDSGTIWFGTDANTLGRATVD